MSAITDAASAAATHPVTVQVINQGPGIGGNVATGLITAGAAIVAVMLTHRFTLRREKQASDKKLAQDRLFIATELVFLLEEFAEICANVANDNGYVNQDALTVPAIKTPDLDYSIIQGDWRALTGRLMYQVRELAVIKSEADRTIREADYYGPDFDEFFCERQAQYTRLGLKSVILAKRLRKFVGFGETRLNSTPWSAQQVLWKAWRQEIRRRSEAATLQAKALQGLQGLVVNNQRQVSEDADGRGGKA